jgi:hypothetical protein
MKDPTPILIGQFFKEANGIPGRPFDLGQPYTMSHEEIIGSRPVPNALLKWLDDRIKQADRRMYPALTNARNYLFQLQTVQREAWQKEFDAIQTEYEAISLCIEFLQKGEGVSERVKKLIEKL